MNTKVSTTVGWVAYTAAFCIGGGYALHRYWNGPGGRKEREAEADRLRAEEEAREAEEEEKIRRLRAATKLASSVSIGSDCSPSDARSDESGALVTPR